MADAMPDPRLVVVEVLLSLGLTTVTAIKDYFTQNSTDDAELAALLAEVDTRIARRHPPPPA